MMVFAMVNAKMVYFVVLTTHYHHIAAQMEIHVAKEIVVLLVEQHVAMELVAILEYVAMERVAILEYVAMELVVLFHKHNAMIVVVINYQYVAVPIMELIVVHLVTVVTKTGVIFRVIIKHIKRRDDCMPALQV